MLAREVLPERGLTLELGHDADGIAQKLYRQGHPSTPRDLRRERPDGPWLVKHPGTRAYRLSDVIAPDQVRRTVYYERVMRREGWSDALSILSWRGSSLQGTLNFYNDRESAEFSARDLRLAETLQPHFHVALSRVLAHEEAGFRAGQFASMLEDLPVGLLLLDWDLRPLWLNGEAAHGCAVWNHGERRAAALHPRRAFRVPAALAKACSGLREQWEKASDSERESAGRPLVISEHALGLHAQIVLRALGSNPLLRPAFQIQLDYRRPRGDRHRPLSPGAVALLARLTAREREVAMRVREGLRTAEIAAELRRSPLTIKTQLASIFAKLAVGSRTRVAALLNR